MKIKRGFLWILFINLLLLSIAILIPESRIIIPVLCVWMDLVLYCLDNISKRVYLLVFLIAFSVFLVGREVFDVFGLHTVISKFDVETNLFAEKLLLVSLIALALGYFTAEHVTTKKRNNRINSLGYESIRITSTRQVSIYLFYGSFIFSVLQLIDVGLFMIRYGYLATYTSYHSSLPYILLKIADITPIAFWIFLATMPSKKDVKKNSLFFGIYLCLTLLTGKRFAFVSGFLVLIAYLIMRNTVKNDGEIWFKKSTALVCIFAVPALSILLYFFSRMRFGTDISGISFSDAFTDFFYGQGVSINVIKYSSLHEFSPEKKYMFSSVMTFLQKNFIARLLGVKSYSGNTVDNALYGNSLAHALSYYLYGNSYLNGRGIGSCYIAEAYHDFKYVGVFLVNYVYGIVLNRFFDFENKGIYTGAISLILLDSLLHAPRGSADGFVSDIVDFTTWGTFIIVFIIAKALVGKSVSRTSIAGTIRNN